MDYHVKEELVPYVPIALKKMGVSNYVIDSSKCIIIADISKRIMKKAIRTAWTVKLSEENDITYVSREDVGSSRNGVIPTSEQYFFEKAVL